MQTRITDFMANSSSDLYLHYFYFQAFGDELDVRQSDFESVRSQGDRLIGQLSDHAERETLAKQMDDISHRLERIQNLMSEKERDIGASHCSVVEFSAALKDCNHRVVQFKTSLRELEDLQSFREVDDSLQLQVRQIFLYLCFSVVVASIPVAIF